MAFDVSQALAKLKRPALAPAKNPDGHRLLSVDTALANARAEAGLDDFGNEDFLVPLRRLFSDVLMELEFTATGLDIFRSNLQRTLVNRLRFERDVKLHPEILDEDVSDPIVITGMPRTGTTKLQRIFSADPNVQALWIWRVLNPAPFPRAAPGQKDPRIAAAKAYEAANDDYKDSHEILAEAADEDLYLLAMSLDFYGQISWVPSHSYLDWVRDRPRLTAYNHEKKMLQYLQWQDGGKRGRRWILKSPIHIGGLDIITELFPRAFIVNSRRRMEECIPSYCKLCEPIWNTDFANITPEWMGWHALHYWGPPFAHAEQTRAKLGDRLNIMDVPYGRVIQDPIKIVEEVYSQVGSRLTDTGRAAMLAWSAENEQHRHGKVEYSLGQYGLTPDMIRAVFPSEQ